jgi:hypothetical protein
MPALIWAHIHTTGPSGHIRYCLLPDPGTQAPKTSNFVDGAAATSPTTNEHGVVRVHERRGYLQRSSLWCEVEVKRNGEGESVTLMMVAHMMCRAKERSEREGAGFERDRAPWMWGFPHHQSPHAGWYPTRRVGYLYSASSPGGLGRCHRILPIASSNRSGARFEHDREPPNRCRARQPLVREVGTGPRCSEIERSRAVGQCKHFVSMWAQTGIGAISTVGHART